MKSLKIYSLILLIVAISVSCQRTEENEPFIPVERLEKHNLASVSGLGEALAPYINPALDNSSNMPTANLNFTYYGMAIDFENILAKIDSSGQVYYAIAVDDEDNSPFTFKNLVIGKTPYGDFKRPFILKYEMSDAFAQEYMVTQSMENFQGKITRSYLPPLSDWGIDNGFAGSKGDDLSEDDSSDSSNDPNYDCPQEFTNGGGGSSSTSGDGSSDPGTMTCEYFQVTETMHYANCIGGDCSFYSQEIASYITIECSIAESTSSDSEGCPNDEGDIPILKAPEWEELIDDSQLKPCMKSLMGNIKSLNKGISYMVKKLAGNTPGFDWEMKDGGLAPSNTAKTTNPGGKIITTFDTNQYQDATDLSITRTILHEAIHAYMLSDMKANPASFQVSFPALWSDWMAYKFGGSNVQAYQHEEMARNLVGGMADSLEEFGLLKGYNLTRQFYEDLSWGGLQGTNVFNGLSNSEQTRINNVVKIELSGKDLNGNIKSQKGTNGGC